MISCNNTTNGHFQIVLIIDVCDALQIGRLWLIVDIISKSVIIDSKILPYFRELFWLNFNQILILELHQWKNRISEKRSKMTISRHKNKDCLWFKYCFQKFYSLLCWKNNETLLDFELCMDMCSNFSESNKFLMVIKSPNPIELLGSGGSLQIRFHMN